MLFLDVPSLDLLAFLWTPGDSATFCREKYAKNLDSVFLILYVIYLNYIIAYRCHSSQYY